MDELGCFDTEELEEELERRKEEKRRQNKPQQLVHQDWSGTRRLCQSHIDSLFKSGYDDDDIKQYIYESAMESVFGRDVWKWINARGR